MRQLWKITLRRSLRAIELIPVIVFLNGCILPKPIQWQEVGGVGRFEFREPMPEMSGVVIGAPHGDAEPLSADLARYVSNRTGAGLALAYGFKSKRVSVAQRIVRSEALPPGPRKFLKKGSIFHEYRTILHRITDSDLELYVGIHIAPEDTTLDKIEVVPSGFTFEEMKILKESFARIRDRQIREREAVKISMAIEPLERISWYVSGVKHHGVLMIAQKGLNVRMPRAASRGSAQKVYSDVLSEWIVEVVKLVRPNVFGLPRLSISIDELVIEPLDTIQIGAWPAKAQGILTAARKSLHVELPGANLLGSAKVRAVYAAILADLLKQSATLLAKSDRVSSAPHD